MLVQIGRRDEQRLYEGSCFNTAYVMAQRVVLRVRNPKLQRTFAPMFLDESIGIFPNDFIQLRDGNRVKETFSERPQFMLRKSAGLVHVDKCQPPKLINSGVVQNQ